jgi:hypothetical protein
MITESTLEALLLNHALHMDTADSPPPGAIQELF